MLLTGVWITYLPDSKVHGDSRGPTWVLSALAAPHVGPMHLCYQGDILQATTSNALPWNKNVCFYSKFKVFIPIGPSENDSQIIHIIIMAWHTRIDKPLLNRRWLFTDGSMRHQASTFSEYWSEWFAVAYETGEIVSILNSPCYEIGYCRWIHWMVPKDVLSHRTDNDNLT